MSIGGARLCLDCKHPLTETYPFSICGACKQDEAWVGLLGDTELGPLGVASPPEAVDLAEKIRAILCPTQRHPDDQDYYRRLIRVSLALADWFADHD